MPCVSDEGPARAEGCAVEVGEPVRPTVRRCSLAGVDPLGQFGDELERAPVVAVDVGPVGR